MLKISIITATYNREDTVSRALESICSQTYGAVEKIIVDGLSTDNTAILVEQFLNHDDVLVIEKDCGIYDALNKGVRLSSGDVIGFLHSDDLYPNPEVLQRVAAIFESNDCDMVYGDAVFFEASDITKLVRLYKSRDLSIKNLSWGHMPAHPAIFCRREVFEAVGFFKTDYEIAADYEWLCRVAQRKEMNAVYVDEALVKMQTGGASGVGIRKTLTLNLEVYRALKSNGIRSNFFMILSKYLAKFTELFRIA